MSEHPRTEPPRQVGRYVLFGEIASGGMAAVHYGLLNGPVGFRRTVAVKRLHENFARDPTFVTQFLDEARLAARIRHPNVVQTLDVVTANREVLLVMEYVDGETLADLRGVLDHRGERFPIDIAIGVLVGALHGLDAAHEARDENGVALNIVHRDVSPQNIMLGRDGVPRVLDFGVAKAAARFHSTQGETVKGKLKYMAPEQVTAGQLDRRTDVFAAGIVLWETLTGQALFEVPDGGAAAIINRVVNSPIHPPGRYREGVPKELDAAVMKALERDPERRYQTALDFAEALERAIRIPTALVMGRWVVAKAGEILAERATMVASIEKHVAAPAAERFEVVSGLTGSAPGSSGGRTPANPMDRTVADGVPSPDSATGDGGEPSAAIRATQVRDRKRLVAVLLVLLVGAVLVVLVARSAETRVGARPGTSASPSVGALVQVRVDAGPPASERAPVSSVPPPGTQGGAATTAPSAASSVDAVPPRRSRKRPKCSPRWVDSEGIWHIRRECL